MGDYAPPVGKVDARTIRVAIVVGRFNRHLTEGLLAGARELLAGHGAPEPTVAWVPGAFELALVAQRLAPNHDAVIALGAVVRGDTPHFEFVAGQAAAGLTRVGLDTGVPVVFGVLTTDTVAQAEARIGGAEGHKGQEAALSALEMVDLLRRLGGPTH